MKPVHVDSLRYLSAAMAYEGRASSNACVQWSAALALDLPESVLTFATLRAANEHELQTIPGASRVPFIHAWVEFRGAVLAPTTAPRTGGVLVPMSIESYYSVNGVRDVRPVPRAAFDRIARKFGLAAALKHGRQRFGSSEVADALLEAAGVRYVLGANKALLPAPGVCA